MKLKHEFSVTQATSVPFSLQTLSSNEIIFGLISKLTDAFMSITGRALKIKGNLCKKYVHEYVLALNPTSKLPPYPIHMLQR